MANTFHDLSTTSSSSPSYQNKRAQDEHPKYSPVSSNSPGESRTHLQPISNLGGSNADITGMPPGPTPQLYPDV